LAAAIIWVLDHPEDAVRMGEHGYQRLLERFPIAANVRATEQLYDRILGERPSVQPRMHPANEDANVDR
jgi:hypothetical protein